MRGSGIWIALLVGLAGCGGCERSSAPGPGGGAPGAVRAGEQQPGAVSDAPPAAVAPATEVPPAETPAAAAAPATPAAEEGDCIVIGDAIPDYGAPPLNVEFSAEAECSAGQPTFRWDFGDGSPPSNQPNVTHTYRAAGDYTAVVTVTGPDGSTSTDEIDITVEEDAIELE